MLKHLIPSIQWKPAIFVSFPFFANAFQIELSSQIVSVFNDMNQTQRFFLEWCQSFQSKILPNHPDIYSNLEYFQRLLNYFFENQILPDPYQQFSDLFINETIPQFLNSTLELTQLDTNIFSIFLNIFEIINKIMILLINKSSLKFQTFLSLSSLFNTKKPFYESNNSAFLSVTEKILKDVNCFINEFTNTPKYSWLHFYAFFQYFSFFITVSMKISNPKLSAIVSDWIKYILNHLHRFLNQELKHIGFRITNNQLENVFNENDTPKNAPNSNEDNLLYLNVFESFALLVIDALNNKESKENEVNSLFEILINFVLTSVCVSHSNDLQIKVNNIVKQIYTRMEESPIKSTFKNLINTKANECNFKSLIIDPKINIQFLQRITSSITFNFTFSELITFLKKSLILPSDNQAIINDIISQAFQSLSLDNQFAFSLEVLKIPSFKKEQKHLLQIMILSLYQYKPEISFEILGRLLNETDTKFTLLVKHTGEQKFIHFIFSFLLMAAGNKKSISILDQYEKHNVNYHIFCRRDMLINLITEKNDQSFLFFAYCFKYSTFTLTKTELSQILIRMLNSEEVFAAFNKAYQWKSFLFCTSEAVDYAISILSEMNPNLTCSSIICLADFFYTMTISESMRIKEIKSLSNNSNALIKTPLLFSIKNFTVRGFKELLRIYLIATASIDYIQSKLDVIMNSAYDYNQLPIVVNYLSDLLQANSHSPQVITRCYDFLCNFMTQLSAFLNPDDVHIIPHKPLSNKGKIKLILIGNYSTIPQIIYCQSSDLISSINFRAQIIFNSEQIELYYNNIIISNYVTLEMLGISDGSKIQVNYIPENNDTFLKNSSYRHNLNQNEFSNENVHNSEITLRPEFIFSESKITTEALRLLNQENLSTEISSSILNFLNRILTPTSIKSYLDKIETIYSVLLNCKNPGERQYYIRAIFNQMKDNPTYKAMLMSKSIFCFLVSIYINEELDKQGKVLILNILKEIYNSINSNDKDFIEIMPKLVLQAFEDLNKSTSYKLSESIVSILVEIFKKFPQILVDYLQVNIFYLVNNMKLQFLGKIIHNFTNDAKNLIFQILFSKFDLFKNSQQDVERKCIYFDALLNSIVNSNIQSSIALKQINEYVLHNLYHDDHLLTIYCSYLCNSFNNYQLINTNYLFEIIETVNNFRPIINLLKSIISYNQSDLDFSNLLFRYVSDPLPSYGLLPESRKNNNKKSNRYEYTGLKNLGATCYANCSLQMLYGFGKFTDSFLQAKLSEHWQIQMQSLFSLMKFGQLDFADPTNFMQSIKLAGESINFYEQQDTVEFLSTILNGLPPDLTYYFSGALENKFEGINLPFNSSNEERFFTLPVEVNGYESLEDSLQNFGRPEIVKNYKDQTRNIKIEANHTTTIKQLPNILIIQLGRFIYNKEKQVRQKINSAFYFPMSLDMSKYSEQTNSHFNPHYNLIGVILHIGTADFGHFNYISKLNGKWMSFNDSHVSKYSIANLSHDAFGSNDSNMPSSAYVLVYSNSESPSVLNEAELSLNNLNVIKKAKALAKKQICVRSDDFFDLIMTIYNSDRKLRNIYESRDIEFLYYYYTNVLMHMQNLDHMEKIKEKIIQLLIDTNCINLIIPSIVKNCTSVVKSFFYCKNTQILKSYNSFLSSIFYMCDGSQLCFIVENLLGHLSQFFFNQENALIIVKLVHEFISSSQDNLLLAYQHSWPNYLIGFLYTWYNFSYNQMLFTSVDFSIIFHVIKQFMDIDPTIFESMKNLEAVVSQSSAHVAAFYELVEMSYQNRRFMFPY
ncbi:hypothetical protein TRFO_08212 [Tritrichomonas foetus]|uniref:USP domain-containing protein n=1 Tax=Tritrichomonas foetus TaxID=1144522 RepID=A0A1J4JLD7_9EUKA|nr:hypothetical protein TRFO_08212 [Tritrichomonas foetus]|eukprot:OHS99898.1 hypothetical protein TRFO_08212 [Tritrichomonas foetus]